jgi:Predicted membrane protein (DUF2214)
MRAFDVAYLLLVCATAIECFTAISRNDFHSHSGNGHHPIPTTTRSLHHVAADGKKKNSHVDRRTHHHESGSADVSTATSEKLLWMAAAPAALVLWTATPAEAADTVVPSALWAYGHYLSMLVAMGSLVAERVLIRPQMSIDEEKALRLADLVYVVSLAFLLVSGGLRATEVRRQRPHLDCVLATYGASHFLSQLSLTVASSEKDLTFTPTRSCFG